MSPTLDGAIQSFFEFVCYHLHLFPAAYKKADGMKIDGRRVLVDVERARTVKGWLPRRLGKITICACIKLNKHKVIKQAKDNLIFN